MTYEWTVIGAGPAGIATIGKLLDRGVSKNTILWLDQKFHVGDFGSKWKHVESNTSVESFIYYYDSCQSFEFEKSEVSFLIEKLAIDKFCPLAVAAEPLHWLTSHLQQKVDWHQKKATLLQQQEGNWHILLDDATTVLTKKVVLAIGATANCLDIVGQSVISLEDALMPDKLAEKINSHDEIALFGCGQSARSILENLTMFSFKAVHHFYRYTDNFEFYFGDFEHAKVHPKLMQQQTLFQTLKKVNKVIYAIGFTKRILDIKGLPKKYSFDERTGEILPNLYGLGIAFPSYVRHQQGQAKLAQTAIAHYVDRLDEVLVTWLQ